MKRVIQVLLLSSFSLLVSGNARAWCRTTTCDRTDPPANCGTSISTACTTTGTPIAWPSTCVSTSVSAHGSVKLGISAAEMRQEVQDAFKEWTTADCGDGKTPNFVVDIFPDVNCTNVTGDKIGFKSEGPNYNVWIFRDSDWPYGMAGEDENAIAITTTQFSETTGVIYDSDVEFNSQFQDFSTQQDVVVRMDLPSVIQHEAGHFLGLAHSQAPNATMLPSLDAGDTSRRSLESDDISAICAAYPPGQLDPSCDPEPRHGFSTECTFDKGCSTVSPGSGRSQRLPAGLLTGAMLALVIVRRRRVLHLHT